MHNNKIIKIELEDYRTLDKLGTLAIEYAITIDELVNIAILRLLEDIEFFRDFRNLNSGVQ